VAAARNLVQAQARMPSEKKAPLRRRKSGKSIPDRESRKSKPWAGKLSLTRLYLSLVAIAIFLKGILVIMKTNERFILSPIRFSTVKPFLLLICLTKLSVKKKIDLTRTC